MIKHKLTNQNLDLKESICKRITNPFYLIAVALTALGAYGFYLTNPSPSIDWLSYDRYYSGMLFGQGRFTATIVERVLNLWDCPVWFEPLLGLVCFILGTLIMLAIFDGFTEYQFKVLENGPLRGMVRTTTFYGNSTLTIDWILYAQAKSIEAHVQLDWHEKQKMLKFSFPVNLENPVATVEAPYAYSSIRQDGTEEPGHRWIDLSGTCNGESYGLSIINDAKYAYSVHGHDMRITIVRSPIYAINAPRKPDPSKEYPWMDQGIQTFNMKIVPHRGDWRQVNIPRQADLFCQPPITTYQGIHNGHLPKTDSFLKIDAPGIRITVLKQAETNNDLIIRCIESFGKRCVAHIDFPSIPANWRGEFTPFEIKSLRINPRNGQISMVNLLEE